MPIINVNSKVIIMYLNVKFKMKLLKYNKVSDVYIAGMPTIILIQ